MTEAIKIAVRVRPFNDKEKSENQELCVEMTDVKVTINDVSGQKPPRFFTFDHAFWSHDGSVTEADGYSAPAPGSQYTDQKKVWNLLGTSVLEKAWKGLNNTLFAYGQTGAGKSYSIFGYPGNPGIIPMAATELFVRVNEETDPNVRYEITVQMVEIYMEKIQDLLIPAAKRTNNNLPIKQSKTGVYVQGATKTAVQSYADIKRVVDMGEGNRTLGATQMNATSSRSHTVVTIDFNKVTKMAGKEGRLKSMINIVDLAGSEKSTQAGTTGDRLAEGNAINKSLSCLGNVIEVLADHCMGKNLKRVVPYRDSSLTRMLQDALGGNSATIMICAIRPGHLYYEETLNTLKYADRAKKIKNKPTVNEDPAAKLIRELQEENAKLKAQLAAGGGGGGGGFDPEAEAKLKEAEERIRQNQLEMEEMSKSWEQKMAEQNHKDAEEEQKKKEIEIAKKSGKPQILNLNEDGMLDRKIFLDLSKHTNAKVGRKQPDPNDNPEVTLGGIGIQSQHAYFATNGNQTQLVAYSDEAAQNVFVNGVKLSGTAPYDLKPNDRIIFGTGTVLLYRCQDRDNEVELKDTEANPISYEFAMSEKSKIEDAAEAERRQQEKEQAEAEAKAKMDALRQEMEDEKAKQEALQEEARKQLEAEMAKLRAEVEAKKNDEDAQREAQERETKLRIEMEIKLKQEQEDNIRREKEREERIKQEEAEIKQRQADNSKLESTLEQILPMVREANVIAADFQRDIRFNSQLTSQMPDFGNIKAEKRVFQIKVDNREDGYFYVWDPEKFTNRVEMMRAMYNEYIENDCKIPDFSDKNTDPFWDPPEPILIGKSYLQLQALSYILGSDTNHCPIFTTATNVKGGLAGKLTCSFEPCDADGVGEADIPDDFEDEPEQLLGKEIIFRVEVEKAQELPEDMCKDVHVNYLFKHEPDVVHRVPAYQGRSTNPVFNFKKVHRFDDINNYMLDYMSKGNIVFKTYCTPSLAQQKAHAESQPKIQTIGEIESAATASAAPASAAPASSASPSKKQSAPVKVGSTVSQDAASAAATTQGAESTSGTTQVKNGAAIAVVEDKKGSSCCTIF